MAEEDVGGNAVVRTVRGFGYQIGAR